VAVARRTLCASDLSAGADEAIRQADAIARSRGAMLEVLTVVQNPVPSHAALGQRALDELGRTLDALRAKAATELAARVAALTRRDPTEAVVSACDGVPYAAIVRRAEASGAELIVVGGKGATGLRMQHLGEVAERVVRHAHVPVLVARACERTGKVLAATDLSDPSLPAIVAASEEARRRGAALTVVHNLDPELKAIGPEVVATLVHLFSAELLVELERAARFRLDHALEELGVSARTVITHGSAAASILRLAEHLPAELVVTGTSGSTGLASVLFGRVAESVVRWAPCSVLVVRRKS
jgi:nucleotide-binding universal stress UspA family protein